MPTIKQMLASGITEIDVDACDMPKGRGHMEPYCDKRSYGVGEAALLKISKAEQLVLDARPLTVIPPHPDVAAYTAIVGAKAARNEFIAFRGAGYSKEKRADVAERAWKQLQSVSTRTLHTDPDIVVKLKAIIAWYSGPMHGSAC